jgi:hypothetical protein
MQPPPLAASEWEPSSAGQWETSMLPWRNMDHPRCWSGQESCISGFRMPNAVDWRSIAHHYTGLGKRHASCETVHDFWVRARVYIDTFLSDIWLGLHTVWEVIRALQHMLSPPAFSSSLILKICQVWQQLVFTFDNRFSSSRRISDMERPLKLLPCSKRVTAC